MVGNTLGFNFPDISWYALNVIANMATKRSAKARDTRK